MTNKCEHCGAIEGAIGYRNSYGVFQPVDLSYYVGEKAIREARKAFSITITFDMTLKKHLCRSCQIELSNTQMELFE